VCRSPGRFRKLALVPLQFSVETHAHTGPGCPLPTGAPSSVVTARSPARPRRARSHRQRAARPRSRELGDADARRVPRSFSNTLRVDGREESPLSVSGETSCPSFRCAGDEEPSVKMARWPTKIVSAAFAATDSSAQEHHGDNAGGFISSVPQLCYPRALMQRCRARASAAVAARRGALKRNTCA